jgi:hypothetical protein
VSEGNPIARAMPDYAMPETRGTISTRLYRVSVICGAIPLIVGGTVFLLFWLTRSSLFATLGFFTVLGGVLLFGVGAISLAVFSFQVWRAGRDSFRRWRGWIGLALVLLCSNFPAAVACIEVGTDLMSTIYITVQNSGTTTIDSFEITWPGGVQEVGPIAPGASASTSFVDRIEGDVNFREVRGMAVNRGELIGDDTKLTSPNVNVVASETLRTVNGSPAAAMRP